jgi:capsular polysaccharide biosynthesis protein
VDELVYSTLLLHHFAPSLLCRKIFDRMVNNAVSQAGLGSEPPGERIYVSRVDSKSRPMTNEDELVNRLAMQGIEPVIASSMSIQEQISRFHSARLVIGAHGAGLGNIVFCHPKTIMYELIPEHWTDSFVGPSINLFAQLRGMNYWADAHVSHGDFARFGHQVPWTANIPGTFARLAQIEAAYPSGDQR